MRVCNSMCAYVDADTCIDISISILCHISLDFSEYITNMSEHAEEANKELIVIAVDSSKHSEEALKCR